MMYFIVTILCTVGDAVRFSIVAGPICVCMIMFSVWLEKRKD